MNKHIQIYEIIDKIKQKESENRFATLYKTALESTIIEKKIRELKKRKLSSDQILESLETFISTFEDEGIKYSDLSKIEEEYLKELKSQLLFKIIEETKSENPQLTKYINESDLTELQDKISKTVTLEEADQDKLNQILYETVVPHKPGNELATNFKTALYQLAQMKRDGLQSPLNTAKINY